MTTVQDKTPKQPRSRIGRGNHQPEDIPEILIYEMDAGKPIYYRGYQEVLSKRKKPEEIMGISGIQGAVLEALLELLFTHPLKKTLRIFPGEWGLQIDKGVWRACDVAIYPKEVLKNYQFTNKYIDIPPQVVVEVDTKADMNKFETVEHYYHQKTAQLLGFGVERVIWIFTAEPRKIMVAEPNADWRITDWTSGIEILPGVSFRLSDLIER